MKNTTSISSRFNGGLGLILIIFIMTMLFHEGVAAQDKKMVVHVAKLKIDPAQLAAYNAALKEHAETAVRVEPGVLTLYAVAEKKDPTQIMVFEIYADTAAYHAHLHSPHFLKYKDTVKNMVKSLELVDVDPVALETKPKL